MDRWIAEQERELLLLVEEYINSSDYQEDMEMIEQYQSPFKIGDTVRIVGPMYTGQVGELKVIDPENIESCDFFCVYLDSVEKVVPFAADELERVDDDYIDDDYIEPTEENMRAEALGEPSWIVDRREQGWDDFVEF